MHNPFTARRNRPTAHRGRAGARGLKAHSLPHPSEEADEDEEGLALPVNPDEGTPLIPDEEGHVEVPG